jgi:hypothetical protein
MSCVEPNSAAATLERRVRDLASDLASAEELLGRIDPRLWQRVRVRMETRLVSTSAAAEELRKRTSASAEIEHWAELTALSCEVDDLLQECADLLAGAAERALGLDDGYCELADALADELVARTTIGHWGSFSLIGRSERYARASRVIQVRFPATSVWQLPIVAHELGHFVGPALVEDVGLRSEHPLDRLFADLGDGTETSWSWLQELFADAFAVHLLGPAYAYTAAMVVFDPLAALVLSDTHPAPQHRIELMAGVLEAHGDSHSTLAAGVLRQQWDALVTGAEGAEGREPLGPSRFAEPLVDLVRDHLLVSRWNQWDEAEQVAAVLERGDRWPRAEPPAIATILNGAWRARLRSPSPAGIDAAGNRALAMARALLERED